MIVSPFSRPWPWQSATEASGSGARTGEDSQDSPNGLVLDTELWLGSRQARTASQGRLAGDAGVRHGSLMEAQAGRRLSTTSWSVQSRATKSGCRRGRSRDEARVGRAG